MSDGEDANVMEFLIDAPKSKPKPVKPGQSKIVFDHFNYPTGDECVKEEMPKGKAKQPKTIYANPAAPFTLPLEQQMELMKIHLPSVRRQSY